MLNNTPLEGAVLERLDGDPRITDSSDIAVSAADGGTVILRGTVASFSQRRAAAEVATSVRGVHEVDNQLEVNLPSMDSRDDDEIRGAALQLLIWDTDVPSDSVDVEVENGWVSLTGNVTHQFQSDAAYDDVASMRGVYGITNEVVVSTP
ncbi:MAG: BON domain-containing protein [Solirubrobacterales bacterium]|nr:BON domain-containing protein [Solirubrobacterales bacterium]